MKHRGYRKNAENEKTENAIQNKNQKLNIRIFPEGEDVPGEIEGEVHVVFRPSPDPFVFSVAQPQLKQEEKQEKKRDQGKGLYIFLFALLLLCMLGILYVSGLIYTPGQKYEGNRSEAPEVFQGEAVFEDGER